MLIEMNQQDDLPGLDSASEEPIGFRGHFSRLMYSEQEYIMRNYSLLWNS